VTLPSRQKICGGTYNQTTARVADEDDARCIPTAFGKERRWLVSVIADRDKAQIPSEPIERFCETG
jgi:hypothetical protein